MTEAPLENRSVSTPAAESAPLNVVFAGGGTAGHITPMLAIARALQQQCPGTVSTMVGTASGMETRIVPEAGFELETIDRVPMPRKPTADLFKLPGRFARAVKQSKRILTERRADVLVGVGGYVCTPMYMAARQLGIPMVIHEANAHPGLANRVGQALGGEVSVAFASTPLRNTDVVGMPMRGEVASLDRVSARAAALEALEIPAERRALPVLVVTGGSLGAASLNRALSEFVRTAEDDQPFTVVHITGRGKQVMDPAEQLLAGSFYLQREYVSAMEYAYSAADLLVARSGAGTVSEIAATGTPAVLVPLPHGNGEQKKNAQDLIGAGGAVLIDDASFTAEAVRSTVVPLLTDPARLAEMGKRAASVGRRDAADVMAAKVLAAARR